MRIGLSQVLTDCVNKAAQQGYTQRRSVLFYVDMLIILGIDCENDPQYPWIKQTMILNKELSESNQINELYQALVAYLEKITGNQNQYLNEALKKLQGLTLEGLAIDKKHYIENVHQLLSELYPAKYQQTPYENITQLVEHGTKKAYRDYHFEQSNHVTLIILFMFFLGAQFDHDPFCPLAFLEKINMEKELSLEAKAEKLANKAKVWLEAYLKNEPFS